LVDPTDPENFRKALTPRTKAIFLENLANPAGSSSISSAWRAIARGGASR